MQSQHHHRSRAQELRPSACTSAPIPIAYSASHGKRWPAAASAGPAASPTARLARKYVAYRVDDSRTSYGTLARAKDAAWTRPHRASDEEEPLLKTPAATSADCSSNQSETESDSDSGSSSTASTSSSSSAGAAVASASSALQSILRIRSGDLACRSVRKQASVEFAIDVSDDEADAEPRRWKRNSRLCSARCVPRRLTIEEKAALYQVRPDLELTPRPLLMQELEETRRRKQRKLVFSVLGAALLALMVVVFYYTISQMDVDA